MNYIVWVEDYSGSWKKQECGDKPAAEREIFEALKQGKTPVLTIEVPYSCNVKMGEVKDAEALTHKVEERKTPPPPAEETKSEASKDKT